MDSNTLFTVALVLVFGVMIFFMFRNSRKRRRDQENMQEKLVAGADVMTSHGIYGRVISIDRDKNEAVIETMPGHLLRLHPQTLTRVVEPLADTVEPEDEAANVAIDERDEAGSDRLVDRDAVPEFGERAVTEDAEPVAVKPKRAPPTKVVAEEAVTETVAEKPKRAPRKRPAAESSGTEQS